MSLASPSSRKRDIDQVEQISLLDGNDDRLAPKRKRTRLDKTALECPVCKSTRSCMHHINMPATPNIDLASHSHVGSPSRILVFKVSKTILESFAAASTPVSKASNHVEKGSTTFGKFSAPVTKVYTPVVKAFDLPTKSPTPVMEASNPVAKSYAYTLKSKCSRLYSRRENL